jgi:hypothetical protein
LRSSKLNRESCIKTATTAVAMNEITKYRTDKRPIISYSQYEIWNTEYVT